jgi:NAD(P)H-dependent flavin oxidoreductase YrpB (nitropropane dioxygenase family)
MKKYILISAALFLASFAYTQSDKEEIDLIQAAFGKEKKAIVADFVQLSDTQKEPFWNLYDEYETKRKEYGRERIDLLKQYAEQYMTMTSEQADAWTKKVMELQVKTDKLIATYYEKVKGISDGVVATQFYQIENYILSMIRMQILQEVPFLKK